MNAVESWQSGEWLPTDAVLYGTGRQAIRDLLQHGVEAHGWRRVFVPSYSCPELVQSISHTLPTAYYRFSPESDAVTPELRHGEVLLVTSLFGTPPDDQLSGANVILDVTHDPIAPWLEGIDVGYVMASLRKTLPVPDGAAIWSPQGLSLPKDPRPDVRHINAVEIGIRAMYLKSEYLNGAGINKTAILRMFADMESKYRCGMPAKISTFSRNLLNLLPVHEWRRQRLANIRCLADAIGGIRTVTVLPSTFGLVALFESNAQRERTRQLLIDRHIYPAILWTLDEARTFTSDYDFSQRMLFLHTDFRWGQQDMYRVAEQIAVSLGLGAECPR